ncbi:MAG: dienelactone hydrolase family protein [Hyphomonadaceae bacterium]|nr:dienelactone hydrolase family protein [Hyphomonadaceae bacterium]
MTDRWEQIDADGGAFKAFVAAPSGPPRGAVVVIQEIFGVNEGVRGKCAWLAGEGYLAIAPDLFWRLEPGVELTDKTEGEWKRAFDLMNRFNPETGVADIQRTVDHVRASAKIAKVGAVGYCLGGLLAYLTACRTTADAAVGYYGVSIDQKLAEAATLSTPLMLHIAGKDQFVPKAAQDAIVAGLGDKPGVSLHVYPDQDHAFTRVGGAHFDAHAAELADARTVAFFRQHIG